MREILNSDEKIITSIKPVFTPFVIRGTPKILVEIFSLIILYVVYLKFTKDSDFLKEFKASLTDINPDVIFLVVILIFSLPVVRAVIEMLGLILIYFTSEYAFTNSRVIFRNGLYFMNYRSVDYNKITEVEVNVNPLEKLFSVGTVKIYTGHSSDAHRETTATLYSIKNPYDVFNGKWGQVTIVSNIRE